MNLPEIEIVRADFSLPKHRAALVELMDAYARDRIGGGAPLNAEVASKIADELLSRPNCHAILAFVDSVSAGMSINFEVFSTFACSPILNIHDFAVMPQFRRQGVAKLMLQEVEAIGVELNCCKLTLEVLEGNELAQGIYKRFGFSGYGHDPQMGRAMFYEKKLAGV